MGPPAAGKVLAMIGGHNQDSVRVSMAGRHPVKELPQSTVALGDAFVIAQPQQVDFVLHLWWIE